MGSLFGGGSAASASREAAALSQRQAAAAQRRQLAELAQQQAQVDQAKAASGGSVRGRRLLTYLSSATPLGAQQDGAATLGGGT